MCDACSKDKDCKDEKKTHCKEGEEHEMEEVEQDKVKDKMMEETVYKLKFKLDCCDTIMLY